MASLKAVKDRIATVTSTRKITSAMKMIASSKLHKAQSRIENMLPYERRLNRILIDFLAFDSEERSIYTENRVVKSVAIVVFSSNASLVGGFNANVIRRVTVMLDEYKYLGIENIHIYPVGKKVAEAVKKLGFKIEGNFTNLAEKPSYEEASDLARILMDKFKKKKIDKVELLYHDFNIEPNSREIMESLVPKVLLIKMYTVLLDSNASEHAARTMAMQLATDNANDLLQELNLQYNKTRQQAITNELLDIVGGSFK